MKNLLVKLSDDFQTMEVVGSFRSERGNKFVKIIESMLAEKKMGNGVYQVFRALTPPVDFKLTTVVKTELKELLDPRDA